MQDENTMATGLGRTLLTSKLAQVGEVVIVFIVAVTLIMGAQPLVGENPLARQGVVWVANVLMLVMVWLERACVLD